MKVIDEKLDKFAHEIMADVTNKRLEILEGVDKAIQEEYEEKEIEYYTIAYDYIQDGLKNIDRQKNEITSQAIVQNKTSQLNKRIEIINKVLESARDELRAFTKKEDYRQYLFDMIKEDLSVIGNDLIEITINASDEGLLEQLKERFDVAFKVERKSIDFIGGCRIFSRGTNAYLDDSFETKLMNQKESFMQKCHLEIE